MNASQEFIMVSDEQEIRHKEQFSALSSAAKADYFGRLEKTQYLISSAVYDARVVQVLKSKIQYQRKELQKSQWFYFMFCILSAAAHFFNFIALTTMYFAISFCAYMFYAFAVSQFKIPGLLQKQSFHQNQLRIKYEQWRVCVGNLRLHPHDFTRPLLSTFHDPYPQQKDGIHEFALKEAILLKAMRLDSVSMA